MSQVDDTSFFRTFALVLGALVVFTIFIAIIANIYSPASDRARDPLVQQEQARQIAPVGQSRVTTAEPVAEVQPAVTAAETTAAVDSDAAGDDKPAEAEAEAEAEAAPENSEATEAEATSEAGDDTSAAAAPEASGEIPVRVKAVVATNCAGCHRDGLHGAQRSDDVAAWQALEAKGLEALTASVINGKGAMRPRAETTLTDEEITLAIQHMIAQSVGTDAAADDASDATADAGESSQEASGEQPQATEAEATDSDAGATQDDTANAEVADTAATETATQTETTAVAAAEIPANVKTVVDTLCAGCHISGVANAPKYGDKAAWDERLSMGMDKLLASAIAGKGAMPARGGSQLSDAELRLAIEYMATK